MTELESLDEQEMWGTISEDGKKRLAELRAALPSSFTGKWTFSEEVPSINDGVLEDGQDRLEQILANMGSSIQKDVDP